MSNLRPFNPSVRVDAREAKQDGIALDMGKWFIQGISNDVAAFVDLLGPPLGDLEHGNHPNAWLNILTSLPVGTLEREFFGWMFTRPAGNLDGYTGMDLRAGGSGSAPRPGAPLAKGQLHFTRRRPTEEACEDSQRKELQLRLFLNPTRFVRHQPHPPNILTTPPHEWNFGDANMRTREVPRRRRVSDGPTDAAGETTLDGNDNVLLSRRALSFARPDAWPIHLRRYLEAAEGALDAEFRRASEVIGAGHSATQPGFHVPYYALKKVETYFEFSSPNPTQLLRRLLPALQAIGKQQRTREYPSGLAEGDSDGDASRLLVMLGSGRTLRVYAKTTARLRFEIIHDVKKASVSRLLCAAAGGYTTNSRDELLGWFSILARDAAKQINNVFSILQSRSEPFANSADTYELLGEIFGTVKSAARAQQMLALLVENGCLRVNRRGSDFMPEIQQLRRKGILENVRGANNVTARYRAALDTLRTQAGLSPLTLTNRMRDA